jgi:hypothetical protein
MYGVGGLACASVAMLVAFQEKLVYVPVIPGMKRGYPILPSRLHLRYEDVWLTAKDGVRLHSWYIEAHPKNPGPTVLFFQENAGNIAHRLQFVEPMVRRLQCNVFMLSYRGYGDSEGFPSQHGLKMDAQAALDYLYSRSSVDSRRIVVFGRSLGGAVGAALVRENPGKVAGLILENTFTSVLDMAGVMLPGLRYIVGGKGGLLNWFVKSPWKTIELIKHIDAPILFLAGQLDEMVPPAHMQRLYEAAQETSSAQHTFVEFPDGMHMDTWMQGGERYWRSIEVFLQHNAAGGRSLSRGRSMSQDSD